MGRRKLFILIIVLLLVLPVSANAGKAAKSSEDNKIVTKKLGSLNITVDPRMELLAAVQQQSGYGIMTQLDFKYKEDMQNYFKQYKQQKAVKEFAKLSKKGFNFDAPHDFMLHLSQPSELAQTSDFSKYLTNRAGGKNNLISFTKNLRQFSEASNFDNFYNKHISFYNTLVNNAYKDMKDMNLTEALDDYYGMKVNSYNVILSPMIIPGGYGLNVEGKNGLYDIFAIIGPGDVIQKSNKEAIPTFASGYNQGLIWHEFSHSFVNPTTDKYLDDINKYDKLYTKIKAQMQSQAYTSWEICVNEHIVRAVTARLTYTYLGKAAGDQAIVEEENNGFFYIKALCKSLENYEKNRDTYPTFESYYPQLIKVFKELSETDLPDSFYQPTFIGPINSLFSFVDNRNMVIILPTNEEDKTTQDNIYKYAGKIKENFFPKAEIMNDVDALQKDLGNYIIVTYGTIKGNLWMDHYKKTFPFEINADNIKADKEYKGTDLEFISALPNPQNYKNPLLIYTAQKSEDILKINNIYHGPTDYVIAKNCKELQSGYYEKDKDNWSFVK